MHNLYAIKFWSTWATAFMIKIKICNYTNWSSDHWLILISRGLIGFFLMINIIELQRLKIIAWLNGWLVIVKQTTKDCMEVIMCYVEVTRFTLMWISLLILLWYSRMDFLCLAEIISSDKILSIFQEFTILLLVSAFTIFENWTYWIIFKPYLRYITVYQIFNYKTKTKRFTKYDNLIVLHVCLIEIF